MKRGIYGKAFHSIMIAKNKNIVRILYLTAGVIILLQIPKLIHQKKEEEVRASYIEKSESAYAKLLNHRSVYRDSFYSIYIARIQDKNQIIFLSRDTLTDIQANSKFFVHIYPKESSNLTNSSHHIPYNFKGNFSSFQLNGRYFYTTSITLPEFEIRKINLGQFGYQGNPDIVWRIDGLLDEYYIAKILHENGEEMRMFEFREDLF